MQSKFKVSTFALAAVALCASSTAGAVARVPATAIAVAANCATAAGAAGAALAQAPVRPACVLPVLDRVAAAPIIEPGPVVATGPLGGISIFPILAGLAGVFALIYLALDDDDGIDDLSRG